MSTNSQPGRKRARLSDDSSYNARGSRDISEKADSSAITSAPFRLIREVLSSKYNLNLQDRKPGQIVLVPQVMPQLDPNAQPRNDQMVDSAKFGQLLLKERLCVIIAVYWSSMLVLPIYTSNDGGVDQKPEEIKLSSVKLKRHDDSDRKKVDRRKTLLFQPSADFNIADNAYLQLADLFSFSFGMPLTLISILQDESLTKLQRMVQESMDIGMFSQANNISEYKQA